LEVYLDQLGQLLLNEDNPLRRSNKGDDVRMLARARTLTVLRRLGAERKVSAVQFLYESRLIGFKNVFDPEEAKEGAVINLSGGDLSGVNLNEADLNGACLSNLDLSYADLRFADLIEAEYTNLRFADLTGAALNRAALGGADLTGAEGTEDVERQVMALEGATMPNGQKYENWLKDKEGGKND
jgi:hypothetical protein